MHRKRSPAMARGSNPPFIFRDEFADERAAGSINGTLSTDGKATRTVVDTENKLTISEGWLSVGGGKSVPEAGDPGLWESSHVRASGILLVSRVKPISMPGSSLAIALDGNQSGDANSSDAIRIGQNNLYARNLTTNVYVANVTEGTTYILAFIERANGCFYLWKNSSALWSLLWVSLTPNASPLYPGVIGNNVTAKVDFMRVAQLPAPWTDDYGIATQRLAGARSENDLFTHEADCLIGFTVTALSSSGSNGIKFRMQDSNNYWKIYFLGDGSFVLREVASGTGTNRGTGAAGSISVGQRCVIVLEGSIIKIFANDVLKITYASADNFKTMTSGKISLDTGGGYSDLVTWPRVLPGYLQSMLNRYVK